ncbi:extracellular signal-regulated kinase 7-like [Trematomus bernacchii]|uniref:extracellular signal-regulated kinase 7-like n=1 Tax=Trematomus bernacchii TaxID=40690 RepID=UPI00146F4EAB|nr:extracellular signal-regulated kinase 7-like [Trematomus bernacchii]
MVDVLLLGTLEDLGKDDFRDFKWYLNQKNLDGCKPIAVCKLEDASRTKTVTEMTSSYGEEMAMKVAVEILKKMKNMKAAAELTKKYAEMIRAASSSSSSSSAAAASPPAASPPAASPPAASPPAANTMSAQNESVIVAPTVTGSSHTFNITINK